jgi:16S rRNA (cytosine967-C5)-methyltransferase
LELFYGVLRNLTLLDFWVDCLRASHIETNVRDILRLGLYQVFLLKTPAHAAVHETVAIAPQKQRSIINAVLRAATRQASELLAQADAQPLFVRTSHPRFLIERWQQHFGAEHTEELCKWNNRPAPVYGRINRIKTEPETLLRPDSRPLPGNAGFVEFSSLPTAALDSGHYYIQDPSTAIACQLLDPKPGERILDACAGTGRQNGISGAAHAKPGVIIACDRDRERLQILKDNVSRLDATIVRAVRHDWTRHHLPEEILSIAPFDRFLLDAPCTNTGVMRRRIDVRWRLRPEDFSRMSNEQLTISARCTPFAETRRHTGLQHMQP